MTPYTSADKQRQAIEQLVPSIPDLLLDAGVMNLFVGYLHQSGILETAQALFGSMRKSNKGLSVAELFKQMFCFLIDPENRFLVDFDRLKTDTHYTHSIEANSSPMASSHAVKRFYRTFSWPGIFRFRLLLQQLFVWRLHIHGPEALFLSIHPLIDQKISSHRHLAKEAGGNSGMEIHAYNIFWGPFTVDATLRPQNIVVDGGGPYTKMLSRVADNIHHHYGRDLPLVILADGESVGSDPWQWLDPLKMGYLIFAKPRKSHLDYALRQSHGAWRLNGYNSCDYAYLDIKKPPSDWAFPGRTILYRTLKKADQMQFAFAPPEKALFTNIGLGNPWDDTLTHMGRADILRAPSLINLTMSHHPSQQATPITHGGSDFRMPFMHFKPNTAYYYTRVMAQLLYASFKADLMPQRTKVNAVKGPLNTLPLVL